jgi:hypothetical protein
VPQVRRLNLGLGVVVRVARARSSKAADGDSSGRCRSLRDRASIEVQMTPTVVALQTSRHGKPQQGNSHPKTQVPTPTLGHPPPLSTFTTRGPVISSPRSLCQQCAIWVRALVTSTIRSLFTTPLVSGCRHLRCGLSEPGCETRFSKAGTLAGN